MNEQIKIHPSIHCICEHCERAKKQHGIPLYKSKQEKDFKIVLKHIHTTANLNDNKKEIEELGHTVTNIWNIKKQGTKITLYMFYIELKQKSNNKDIYEVDSLLDCRVKFELP